MLVLVPYKFTLLSNTFNFIDKNIKCFSPLQIYTTLKPNAEEYRINTSFSPLQIYTTLKLRMEIMSFVFGFSPLQIYTTLKLQGIIQSEFIRFSPLQIYTTLKPKEGWQGLEGSFSPLQIYTTLKLCDAQLHFQKVLVPYKFTLLSNLKSQSEKQYYELQKAA